VKNINHTPLICNYVPTFKFVSFSELFKWGENKNEPYSNSIIITNFSRIPEPGETFSLSFYDKNGSKVNANAVITNTPQSSGDKEYSPFKITSATLVEDVFKMPLHYSGTPTPRLATFEELFK
jgi:hypothetical protein